MSDLRLRLVLPIIFVISCLFEFFEIVVDVLDWREFFHLVRLCLSVIVPCNHVDSALLAAIGHKVLHPSFMPFLGHCLVR